MAPPTRRRRAPMPRAGRSGPAGALAATCLLAAGCGASGHRPTTAPTSATVARSTQVGARVCAAAAHAAHARSHAAATARVVSGDPGYLECRISAGDLVLDDVAQSPPQARSFYETEIVHLVQTYAEPGGLRDRTQLPRDVPGVGSEAAWVPGQRRFLATNATVSRGGAVVEVTVGGRTRAGPRIIALAREVAMATLATAPRGPDPPPPPQ